jgi:hypothetical protein
MDDLINSDLELRKLKMDEESCKQYLKTNERIKHRLEVMDK